MFVYNKATREDFHLDNLSSMHCVTSTLFQHSRLKLQSKFYTLFVVCPQTFYFLKSSSRARTKIVLAAGHDCEKNRTSVDRLWSAKTARFCGSHQTNVAKERPTGLTLLRLLRDSAYCLANNAELAFTVIGYLKFMLGPNASFVLTSFFELRLTIFRSHQACNLQEW